MQLTNEIRSDMAAKGYVYFSGGKNHPGKDGLREVCTDITNENFSDLIFDTDAYQAHGHYDA